jgi:phage terminase Nu1 subunit (DNA packaging protein)
MRHAQELEMQNEHDSAPPIRRSVNSINLQNQANQLADLAASVPQGVQKANKGLLEKDLIQRLKQIEKLSKQLRNQLDH